MQSDVKAPLCRPDLYAKLMAKLPAITVIYFKPSGGEPALQIGSDQEEHDFAATICKFLRIPASLGRRT